MILPTMQLVPHAHSSPGECALSRTSDGPFVDTGASIFHEGHVFIAQRVAHDIGIAAGLPSVEMLDEVTQRAEDAETRAEALAADVEKLTERLAGLEELREAVATTLTAGAVVSEDGKAKLRVKPGQRRSGVDRLVAEGRAHRSMLDTLDEAAKALAEVRALVDDATAPVLGEGTYGDPSA